MCDVDEIDVDDVYRWCKGCRRDVGGDGDEIDLDDVKDVGDVM